MLSNTRSLSKGSWRASQIRSGQGIDVFRAAKGDKKIVVSANETVMGDQLVSPYGVSGRKEHWVYEEGDSPSATRLFPSIDF